MTAAQAIEVQADYALKGRDYETELLGAITDTIIDADRLARLELRNGFPSFALYRLVLAKDLAYMRPVRQWWVLFSLEWCRSHMRGGFSEELAAVAAWDSLQRVMDPARPILPAAEVADALGVDLETYTRARNNLRRILQAALDAYWELICGLYRVVVFMERRER